MKHIKIIAVALWVSALGTTVHAGDAKFSLLRCGLAWGGSTVEAKTYTTAKKNQKYHTQRSFNFFPTHRRVTHTLTTTTSDNPEQGLLPTTYTIAKVGCSWR
jgi:hypothetical protein